MCQLFLYAYTSTPQIQWGFILCSLAELLCWGWVVAALSCLWAQYPWQGRSRSVPLKTTVLGPILTPPPQTKKVKCEEIHLPFQPNHSAVKGRQHTYTKGMEHHLKFSESLRDIMKAMTAHPFLVSQNPHWVRLATAGSFFFFEQFPVKEAGQEGS